MPKQFGDLAERGESGIQRPVLQPQDEQVRERDPGVVRLPAGVRPGARGPPGRGDRQSGRRDPGQAQRAYVGGTGGNAVVHASR